MALNNGEKAILRGYLDSYCLVCEILINGEKEALQHIKGSSHINNLESAKPVEKFKDDNILKVKQGYFCCYCNCVYATATKMALHVAEAGHRSNRGARLLRREADEIVFQDLLVRGEAWHGILDDMCAVCNAEFEDEQVHKQTSTHIFNLTTKGVEFGLNNEIYRKIDDTTYQCITCNKMFICQDIIAHFESTEHHDLLLKGACEYRDLKRKVYHETAENIVSEYANKKHFDVCHDKYSEGCEEKASLHGPSTDKLSEQAVDMYSKDENNTEILESVIMFGKNEVNINFENQTAFCKKCSEYIQFEHTAIEFHIDEHTKNPKKRQVGYMPFQCEVNIKTLIKNSPEENDCKEQIIMAIDGVKEDSDSETSELEVIEIESWTDKLASLTSDDADDPADFAAQNYLTYKKGSTSFCRLCQVNIPSNLRSMKEHVTGSTHRRNDQKRDSENRSDTRFPKHTKSSSPDKIALIGYVKTVYRIRYMGHSEVVVNQKFRMELISFHLITKHYGYLLCELCSEFVGYHNLEGHVNSLRHKLILFNTSVLTKYRDEFVREVRPGVFHCAFCNLVETSEDSLCQHLRSVQHQGYRMRWEVTLQLHLSDIRNKSVMDIWPMLLAGAL